MIIEFNGLPGTGKTTVAKELNKIFQSKDIWCNMYGRIPTITKKELISCFIKGGWKIYFSALSFAKKEVLATDKMSIKIAMLILSYYILYCKYEKSERVLICDQGIFQALISIAHIDEIKNTDFALKVITAIKKLDVYFVCCEIKPQISEDRLKSRKNGGSRFDKMSEEERGKNLLKQQRNFEILRSCLKETVEPNSIIKINTINKPELNAQLIFDKVVVKNEGKI